jgi:hypothetical protein
VTVRRYTRLGFALETCVITNVRSPSRRGTLSVSKFTPAVSLQSNKPSGVAMGVAPGLNPATNTRSGSLGATRTLCMRPSTTSMVNVAPSSSLWAM